MSRRSPASTNLADGVVGRAWAFLGRPNCPRCLKIMHQSDRRMFFFSLDGVLLILFLATDALVIFSKMNSTSLVLVCMLT